MFISIDWYGHIWHNYIILQQLGQYHQVVWLSSIINWSSFAQQSCNLLFRGTAGSPNQILFISGQIFWYKYLAKIYFINNCGGFPFAIEVRLRYEVAEVKVPSHPRWFSCLLTRWWVSILQPHLYKVGQNVFHQDLTTTSCRQLPWDSSWEASSVAGVGKHFPRYFIIAMGSFGLLFSDTTTVQ